MATDYISLSEAQDAMTAENLIYNLDQVENGDAHRFARAAIRVLERLKPADVRPVVRGEWIETGYFDQYYQPIYECSHCHGEVADSFMAKHLFCLHCGADMRPEGGANG